MTQYGVYAWKDGWAVFVEPELNVRAYEPISEHTTSEAAHAAVKRYREADRRRAR